jgi:pimeloyl-ACP methyl ester carboxylesterase
MIADPHGCVDYEERGSGPTVVLVPGSCSTGAAWRPVLAAWQDRFRCVTTSLLGYGGTAERRTAHDPSIRHEAEALEAVIRKAAAPVHLVGHSFGGLVAITVALRKRADLASLTIVEAPALQLLRGDGEEAHYRAIRAMTDDYFAAFDRGNAEAIGTMIDFYGGRGTFASWPPRVRAYAVETTAVNVLDWASAYGFALSIAALKTIDIPALVLWGEASHPAVQRANVLLAEAMRHTASAEIGGAGHFMIATHADVIGRLIAQHVHGAEALAEARADSGHLEA